MKPAPFKKKGMHKYKNWGKRNTKKQRNMTLSKEQNSSPEIDPDLKEIYEIPEESK